MLNQTRHCDNSKFIFWQFAMQIFFVCTLNQPWIIAKRDWNIHVYHLYNFRVLEDEHNPYSTLID